MARPEKKWQMKMPKKRKFMGFPKKTQVSPNDFLFAEIM